MPEQTSGRTLEWQGTKTVPERADEGLQLETVIREYSRFLFRVAYGVLRNSHDAEDIVQEAFLRVHRSGAKGVQDMRAWLARIAFRLAIDRLRKPYPEPTDEVELDSGAPDAERQAIGNESVKQVRRLIAALPDELRYPLVLSALDDLSSRDIASILGISESSVRGRIFRARQILREKLEAVAGRKS